MTVPERRVIQATVFLLLLLVLAAIGLAYTVTSTGFRHWLEAQFSKRSGYDIRLSDLSLQFPWSIVSGPVEISRSGRLQLTAKRVAIKITPLDLIAKTIHSIDLLDPILQLDLRGLSLKGASPPAQIAVRNLRIANGILVIKDGDATVIDFPNLDLSAQNLNLDEQMGIHLRAELPALDSEGDLQLKGAQGELVAILVLKLREQRPTPLAEPKKQSGEIAQLTAKLDLPADEPAQLALHGRFRELSAGALSVTGSVSGRAEIDRKFAAARFSVQADLADFPKSVIPAARSLPGGEARLTFAGAYSFPDKTLSVKSLQLFSRLGRGEGAATIVFGNPSTVSGAKLKLSEIPLDVWSALLWAPSASWKIKGRGEIDVALRGPWRALAIDGTAQSRDAQITAANFSAPKVSFTAPFSWTGSVLRAANATIQAVKPSYGQKTGWQSSADRIDAVANLEVGTDEGVRITGEIAAVGGKFSSADGSKAGENFVLRGPVAIHYDSARRSAGVSGKMSAEAGEILWGKFYSDLKEQKPALEFSADYAIPDASLHLRRAAATLGGIGTMSLAGTIDRVMEAPELRLLATSVDFSPDAFYRHFLLETFKNQYPLVERLAVGGRISFQCQLQGPLNALSVAGELSLQSGVLRARSGDWHIGPMALSLPFQIQLAESTRKSGAPPRSGVLAVEAARFGKELLAPIRLRISLAHNELKFLEPLHVQLFGGEVVVRDLTWPDLIRDPRRLSFSADMKSLQLDEITQALQWPRFSGTLTGTIPKVQSAAGALRTEGEIRAEVFAGQVRISQLTVENPFSSLASIKLDAKVDGLHLEQLSQTLAFGRISGILEGTVDDLVITAGQLAEMRADIRSVARGGVDQRISVQALNNITVLSSGQEAGALYGGLAGFFDSFRYSKLGFRATLRNDRLTLRGVESDGDKEYLVVGSWLPPTVNIVSHTQNIAFSELVRRLERIKSEKPQLKK